MDIVLKSVVLFYLIAAALVLVAIYVIQYLLTKIRIFILGNKLPGPKGWPLFGNALEFLKRDMNFLSAIWKYNQEYGLTRLWLGSLNVFICTGEDAEVYYNSPALYDRSYHFDVLRFLLGDGLLTANGIQWKKAKRLMEPSFSYLSLKNFIPILHEKTDILVRLLEKEVKKPAFSIFDYVKNCTFDIVTRAICDFEMNSQIQHVKVLEDVEVIAEYTVSRMFSVWQQYDFLYKFSKEGKDFFQRTASLKEYIDERIKIKKTSVLEEKKKIKATDDGDRKFATFVDNLINQDEWNDDEIRDHVMTMISTGYETVACQISFTFVLLGIHQDVQKKLYQELSSALGNEFDEKELEKVEYLDQVIKESMRMFTAAPILFRKANEDVQFGQLLVPKGAAVNINIFAIHRNPKHYDNPNEFNPENFSKEKVASRHPFAFVPFGKGIRKCVGEKFAWMVLRIVVTKIVLNYKIECDLRLEDIELLYSITLKMKDGFPVRLLKREGSN